MKPRIDKRAVETNISEVLKEVAPDWFAGPLRALTVRLGIPLKSKPEPWGPDGDDHWGSWTGVGDDEIGCAVCFGFEPAKYTFEQGEEDRAQPFDELVPVMATALWVEQYWEQTYERLYAALQRTYPEIQKFDYPNRDCPTKNAPLLYWHEPVDIFGDKVIWLGWRGCPISLSRERSNFSRRLCEVLEDLRRSEEEFVHACDIAWGAVFEGRRAKLTMDTLTGWCGEVAVLHRQGKQFHFSKNWLAPYDLVDAEGVWVEVKATRQKSGATVHISEREVAAALSSPKGWELVGVRVPIECVKVLYKAIKSALKGKRALRKPTEAKQIAASDERLAQAIDRLAQAIGEDIDDLAVCRMDIESAIEQLRQLPNDDFVFCIGEPMCCEDAFAAKVLPFGPALTFPFESIKNFPSFMGGPQRLRDPLI